MLDYSISFLQSDLWPGLKYHCIIVYSFNEEIKLIGSAISFSSTAPGSCTMSEKLLKTRVLHLNSKSQGIEKQTSQRSFSFSSVLLVSLCSSNHINVRCDLHEDQSGENYSIHKNFFLLFFFFLICPFFPCNENS